MSRMPSAAGASDCTAFTPARIELARPSSQSSFTTTRRCTEIDRVLNQFAMGAEHNKNRRCACLLSASNRALQHRFSVNHDQLLGLAQAAARTGGNDDGSDRHRHQSTLRLLDSDTTQRARLAPSGKQICSERLSGERPGKRDGRSVSGAAARKRTTACMPASWGRWRHWRSRSPQWRHPLRRRSPSRWSSQSPATQPGSFTCLPPAQPCWSDFASAVLRGSRLLRDRSTPTPQRRCRLFSE